MKLILAAGLAAAAAIAAAIALYLGGDGESAYDQFCLYSTMS